MAIIKKENGNGAKKKERQTKILEILRAMQRIVMIDELTQMLGVSEVTIRRDLLDLEQEKSIIRTQGGCMLAGRFAMETQYHKRVAKNFDMKKAIGKRAAQEIRNGDLILIEEGSTAFHLATQLGQFQSLSVYTNSLAVISELSRYPNIALNIIGGIVDSEQYSIYGFLTERTIEQIKFDKVFLEVDAIDNVGNCYEKGESIARLAQIMLRQGKEKILLSDPTKFGRENYFAYASLDDFDKLITTSSISDDLKKVYQKKTEVIITEEPR